MVSGNVGMSRPETKWSGDFGKIPDRDRDRWVWSGPDRVPISPGPNFPNTSLCMVHAQTIQHAVPILTHWYLSALEFLLSRLAHPTRPAIPHALPSHTPWLSRPTHLLSCLAHQVPHTPPIVSHTPRLSAHGVEPSVCGPLPYPLPSPEPPCPAHRQAPTHPLQHCCHQPPATRVTLICPASSPAHTLACLLGPATGGLTQVTHHAPR